MVADLLELDGFDTLYFGANVPTGAMVRRLRDQDIELLGISATIAAHVDQVRRLIAAVRAEPGGREIKIMVGGYAFLQAGDFWRSTGADAFAPDGEAAIAEARRLLAQRPP